MLGDDGSIVEVPAASYCVSLGPPVSCTDELPF
jgi:hypothetical protein